jgi:hypothetical protein
MLRIPVTYKILRELWTQGNMHIDILVDYFVKSN